MFTTTLFPAALATGGLDDIARNTDRCARRVCRVLRHSSFFITATLFPAIFTK